ncbi:MAG: YigZ family protein [Clostridia bacterium]|nr:YigZ family protein [Clostridia bacterium]
MENYLSVFRAAMAEFTERKSVFIGSAAPVSTEEEALEFVNSLRKKYADATHNVYAYIVRENNACRFSDDGEPHGTAGMPVLDVLRKEGLTDVAVVVTRYFGGILLGTGGLVRAYTASAKQAIDAAGRAEWAKCARFAVKSDYSDHQKLSYYFRNNGIEVKDTAFSETVVNECVVGSELMKNVAEDITSLTNGRAELEFLADEYVKREVKL